MFGYIDIIIFILGGLLTLVWVYFEIYKDIKKRNLGMKWMIISMMNPWVYYIYSKEKDGVKRLEKMFKVYFILMIIVLAVILLTFLYMQHQLSTAFDMMR